MNFCVMKLRRSKGIGFEQIHSSYQKVLPSFFVPGIMGKDIYGGSILEKYPTKNSGTTGNTAAKGYLKWKGQLYT